MRPSKALSDAQKLADLQWPGNKAKCALLTHAILLGWWAKAQDLFHCFALQIILHVLHGLWCKRLLLENWDLQSFFANLPSPHHCLLFLIAPKEAILILSDKLRHIPVFCNPRFQTFRLIIYFNDICSYTICSRSVTLGTETNLTSNPK